MLNKHMPWAQHLTRVPHYLAVVKDPAQDAYALYREYVSGVRLLDEMRVAIEGLQKMKKSGKYRKEDITTRRQMITTLLMNAVTQCAYVAACGPSSLADPVNNPLDDYYVRRVDERGVDQFNQLLSNAGYKTITPEVSALIKKFSMPMHERLAKLPTAFYKDAWYANSVIQTSDEGENWYFFDFASVKQLPAVIELATLLCYGGFVNKLKLNQRRDTIEEMLVRTFFNAYSKAVEEYNIVVERYESDPNRFLREIITADMKQQPQQYHGMFRQLLDQVGRFDFSRNPDKRFKKLKSKVDKGKLKIHKTYIYDLEAFVSNLERKSPLSLPAVNTPEYKTAMRGYLLDYYAALFHRSIVLGSTPSGFVLADDPPEEALEKKEDKENKREERTNKKYLLVREMRGTVANAARAAERFYSKPREWDMKPPIEKASKDQLVKIFQGIGTQIEQTYRNRKLRLYEDKPTGLQPVDTE
jgi:hypothetical protein